MKMMKLASILLVLIMMTGCDEIDEYFDSESGTEDVSVESTEDTAVESTEDTSDESTEDTSDESTDDSSSETEVIDSSEYHHYNPNSWEGEGSSIVFCSDSPKYDSCTIDGKSMTLHGSQDHGRDVWTVYKEAHLSGEIICSTGEDSYSFGTFSSSGWQYGSCK